MGRACAPLHHETLLVRCGVAAVRLRERQRETVRERETQRRRDAETQRDREAERQRDNQTERHTNRERHRERQRDRDAERQSERESHLRGLLRRGPGRCLLHTDCSVLSEEIVRERKLRQTHTW